MATDHDVVVIGSGIAGLTATRQLAQAGVAVANIECALFGGLVINVNELEGAIGGSGADLASTLMMEASDLGATTLSETVVALRTDSGALRIDTDGGTLRALAVIVASGARLRRLGVPGEADFEGRGVSQCADCDGPMCKGADVVVVGGGDSAIQEALVLAEMCRTVHLVHRRDEFRARRDLVVRAMRHCNIKVRWSTQVEAILGGAGVEQVRVRTAGDIVDIPCRGVFAYVGLEPACDFVPSTVARDGAGALETDSSLQTSIPGVYAIGAVRSGYGGTLSDAMADARIAASAALRHRRN